MRNNMRQLKRFKNKQIPNNLLSLSQKIKKNNPGIQKKSDIWSLKVNSLKIKLTIVFKLLKKKTLMTQLYKVREPKLLALSFQKKKMKSQINKSVLRQKHVNFLIKIGKNINKARNIVNEGSRLLNS